MALSKKTQKGLTVALASKRLKGLGAVLAAKNTLPAKKGRDSRHSVHNERIQLGFDLREFDELRAEKNKPTRGAVIHEVKQIYRFRTSKTREYRVNSLTKLLLRGFNESNLMKHVPFSHHDELHEAKERMNLLKTRFR